MTAIKGNEKRREDILDVAERLFAANGYDRTTIEKILTEVGIAKGTFYYYFGSKEDVLDAIVARQVDRALSSIDGIAATPGLSEIDKIRMIFLSMDVRQDDPALLEQVHHPANAQMHQKSLVQTVRRLSPVLSDLVRQGIAHGTFDTEYAEESIECILVAALVLFDREIFALSREEYLKKAQAFGAIVERLLGAPSGSFAFIQSLVEKG